MDCVISNIYWYPPYYVNNIIFHHPQCPSPSISLTLAPVSLIHLSSSHTHLPHTPIFITHPSLQMQGGYLSLIMNQVSQAMDTIQSDTTNRGIPHIEGTL